jgi:5-methyltetrahydrofolate--homocysteine methyltransferase
MVPAEKILETAREKKADIVGLSGLITPSLDEMAHVAKEMQRQGFDIPLLIGGATTSKAHTAVKIAPGYTNPVVHVLDASRAVTVVGSLINPQLKTNFVEAVRAEYEKVRSHHGEQQAKPLLSIEDARRRATDLEWNPADIAKPEFSGTKRLATDAKPGSSPDLETFSLSDLVPLIDWSPFFHTWEIRGRYPAILEKPEAKRLLEDAQGLLDQIVRNKQLVARGVFGFFPANAIGDDVQLYTDESRRDVLTTFHFLRQQIEKANGEFNHSLADFIAPAQSGLKDYLGAFAVSTGFGVEELCKKFEHDHDDYNSIMTKALADRLAEAFAEYLHKRARESWGFGKGEKLTNEDLIREQYRGIRPAAGYPACPDHTEKWTLWKLLDVEKNAGIKLTESCAMWPGASVSGLYFAHPESKYFAVGKIGRDQIADYQRRKGLPLEEIERWLGPWLNYEAQPSSPLKPVCACG